MSCPPGLEDKTVGHKKYYIDYSICGRKTNSVMVMIIMHIAHITCVVTKDAWHAYGVIGVHKVHHGADRISYFAEPTILWLAGTVMREVGANNREGGRAACPCPRGQDRWSEQCYID